MVLIEAVKELSAESPHQHRALQAKAERIETFENELQKYKQVMDQVDTGQLLEAYSKKATRANKGE